MSESLDNEMRPEESEAETVSTQVKRGKGFGKKEGKGEKIVIPALKIAVVTLRITGTSPLIVHNFSEKSKREMLDKQMGTKPHSKRAPKDPYTDFLGSLYPIGGFKPKLSHTKGGFLKGGETTAKGGAFGFPANALKLASVSACRHLDGLAMTKALGTFHVMDFLIPILDPKTGRPATPVMREDIVRLAPPARVADLRYRGFFENWMMKIDIRFNAATINTDQIANLLNTAGFAVGLGEWRPEKKGNFGMFQVGNG